VNDILAIAVIVGGFLALVFLAALAYTGLRFWFLCGSYSSAHRIMDAWYAQQSKVLPDDVQ
jgi:hypothetical protein